MKHGYIFVLVGGGRYRPLHALKWEKAHGPIPHSWHVHHIDGDKLNNRISNLICVTASQHGKLHVQMRH